jgi:hypothetical protein
MKQLELITKASIKTPKNRLLMIACYSNLYKIGMVDKATMDKVNNTDYVRGI